MTDKFDTSNLRFKATERLAIMDISDDFVRAIAGLPPTGSREGTRYRFVGDEVVEERVAVPKIEIKP